MGNYISPHAAQRTGIGRRRVHDPSGADFGHVGGRCKRFNIFSVQGHTTRGQPILGRACLGRRVGAVATGRVMGRRRQRTALPTVAHLLLALRHRASASKPPESPMAFLWVRLIPAWSRQALRPASGRKYLRSHFHLASARQIRRAEECRSRI